MYIYIDNVVKTIIKHPLSWYKPFPVMVGKNCIVGITTLPLYSPPRYNGSKSNTTVPLMPSSSSTVLNGDVVIWS